MRIERLDASAECDGLVPTRAPDAVAVSAPTSSYDGCGGPGSVSDGTGHVALAASSGGGWVQWLAVTPGGAPLRTFVTHSSRVLPQPEGWLGAKSYARSPPFGPLEVNAYFPDGSVRSTAAVEARPWDSPIHEWRFAEDPLGGALLVHAWHDTDGSGRCGGDARRIDAAGASRGPPAPIGCATDGAAVSNRGDALVLERRIDERWIHWIRPDGSEARPAALDEDPSWTPSVLAPLLDGSIAAKEGPNWARVYGHLAAASTPAPAWLVRRSEWTFRNTRGNRGYAFFPRPWIWSGDCSQTIEIVAPSGLLCGKVTLLNPGGPCRPGPADQGWDGTIVESDARGACAFRWWPRALAGD